MQYPILNVVAVVVVFIFFYLTSLQQSSGRPSGAAGPSLERGEKTTVGQEIRDRFSGAIEAFARRNASGSRHHSERSKHKILDDAGGSTRDGVDLEKSRASSSRNGSASKRAVMSSTKLSSSADHGDHQPSRASRLLSSSSSSRANNAQRLHHSGEAPRSSSLSRNAVVKSSRDEPPYRSLELLSLGGNKRK